MLDPAKIVDMANGLPAKLPAHRPSRRQEIVDAANKVFARTGFAETSVQDVAEEAGVVPTAVYYHFAGKDELFDVALQGFVNYSKVPLRLAIMFGFAIAALSLLAGTGYLVAKLLFWNEFSLGVAPIVIGFFFLSAVQLIFVGVVGEYVGAIYTQVKNRPLVFERERINF